MTSSKSMTWHATHLLRLVLKNRRILFAVTKVELKKKHSGSAFGALWLLLYPVLLLSIYLFIYAVVFRTQLPGYEGLGYAIYVFCGLIPFIGLSESLSAGTVCLRQNMHLIKNVMLPIELVPIRTVLASLATQMVGLAVLLVLVVGGGYASFKLLLLPVMILFQVLLLVGLVLILSAVAVALPDIGNIVNLLILLVMFVSPIGFTRSMVPDAFGVLIDLNPVSHMLEAFRYSLLVDYPFNGFKLLTYFVVSSSVFLLGSLFFVHFKGMLVDYE